MYKPKNDVCSRCGYEEYNEAADVCFNCGNEGAFEYEPSIMEIFAGDREMIKSQLDCVAHLDAIGV